MLYTLPSEMFLNSYFIVVVFIARRQFTGSGYLEYNIVSNKNNKQINTRKYMLNVEFRTVQPSGLIFHARSAGGIYSDYITLEVVGGRLRYCIIILDKSL